MTLRIWAIDSMSARVVARNRMSRVYQLRQEFLCRSGDGCPPPESCLLQAEHLVELGLGAAATGRAELLDVAGGLRRTRLRVIGHRDDLTVVGLVAADKGDILPLLAHYALSNVVGG